MSNNTQPEIRFPGFMEDWEERKLNELAEFNPKSDLPERFEYVDLESVVGTELVRHRTENRYSAPSRAQRLAKKNDVFYQTVRPYQKNNYLFDLPYDNYVFSTGYAQMRPIGNGYFLLTLIQEEKFVNRVLERSTGTSYPAINSNDLAKLPVKVPADIQEQQKVGTFFKQIDNTITLHQRKLDLLKETKKGFLQKMFPKNGAKVPEIRFPGFTGDWEERKLGEVVVFLNGRAFKQQELLDSGKYRVLRVGNFNTNDRWYYSNLELEEDKYANKGDLLYLWATSFGPEMWNEERVIYHYHIWKLKFLSKELDKQYLYTWLLTDKEKIKESTNGTTMVHVTKGGIEQRTFQFPPDINEQQKIGAFFKQLDDTIALHQRKLDLLKETKKGFLQKMFV
ncbi:restriction endonuclease subunit S [Enterococcus faecium]|uniref:restriction endonuclease subunit S n=1 Tax=Enterococcus faecium TaxID=1352 RepID=UPI00188004F1|nr:restriction endonuclease subunit S [Enterococcus faecium]EKC6797703.1 restriction endonuclease subunit S [Enterococcus faecium]EKY7852300.1 restriction endonuclease subunit S [Enterococcus faecium]EKY7906774.1 restriction endonuclease subunit S [Enterococcus faecium]EKY7919920.1 restriction endonuclease subunit S [Enterococcus faecium]EKY7945998.1 restriction endonuclease subunit S [Enterococcus faecium]